MFSGFVSRSFVPEMQEQCISQTLIATFQCRESISRAEDLVGDEAGIVDLTVCPYHVLLDHNARQKLT